MTHTTRFPDAATAKAWSHYVNWWAKYGEGWSEIRARLDSDDEESDEEPSDSGVTTNERTLDVDPPKKGGKVGVEARYPDLYSDLIYVSGRSNRYSSAYHFAGGEMRTMQKRKGWTCGLSRNAWFGLQPL